MHICSYACVLRRAIIMITSIHMIFVGEVVPSPTHPAVRPPRIPLTIAKNNEKKQLQHPGVV